MSELVANLRCVGRDGVLYAQTLANCHPICAKAADRITQLEADKAVLVEALKDITHLRPFGDVDTCKQPRKLVEQMEKIGLEALSRIRGEAAESQREALSELARDINHGLEAR